MSISSRFPTPNGAARAFFNELLAVAGGAMPGGKSAQNAHFLWERV
jgi:hypothetical protein